MLIVTYQPDGLVTAIMSEFPGVTPVTEPGTLVVSDEEARAIGLHPARGTNPFYVDLSDSDNPILREKTLQSLSVSGSPRIGEPLTLTAPHDFAVYFEGQPMRSVNQSLTLVPTRAGEAFLVDARVADLLPYAVRTLLLTVAV